MVLVGNKKSEDEALHVENYFCRIAHKWQCRAICKRYNRSASKALTSWRLRPPQYDWRTFCLNCSGSTEYATWKAGFVFIKHLTAKALHSWRFMIIDSLHILPFHGYCTITRRYTDQTGLKTAAPDAKYRKQRLTCQKTIFTFHHGIPFFTQVSIRLKSAPVTFKRTMVVLVLKRKWHYSLICFEDIVIFLETPDKHSNHVTGLWCLRKIRTWHRGRPPAIFSKQWISSAMSNGMC